MVRRWFLGVCLLGLGLSCGMPEGDEDWYDSQECHQVVCAAGATTDGIDVSYYQDTIDWDQVAADGIRFAIIRVSDGTTFLDPQFDRNWREAKRVGIIRAAYQYFRPGQDATAQAQLLLNTMGPLDPGDMPPAIDVEATDDQSPSVVANKVTEWVQVVEDALGRKPIIYTRASFWNPYVRTQDFVDYPLWVAHYGANCPNLPDGWTDWAFWQYSSTGSVGGINGHVDMDLFNGDEAALEAFANWQAVCGDGVCSPGEDHASCPQDCPVCENIPRQGRIVDETDVCFERGGTPSYWHPEQAGWDGSLLWTYTVADQMDNHGIWHLTFDEAGTYRIEAYTDADWAESRHAKYQVQHDGNLDVVEVDQTAVDGWNQVGEFQFDAGGDQWVRLEDLTGEPVSQHVRIVFDAIRITRVDLPPEEDGGVDASPGPDASVPEADASAPPEDAAEQVTDSGPEEDGAVESNSVESGCGCRNGAGESGSLPILLGLLGFWLAGRRRRRQVR